MKKHKSTNEAIGDIIAKDERKLKNRIKKWLKLIIKRMF